MRRKGMGYGMAGVAAILAVAAAVVVPLTSCTPEKCVPPDVSGAWNIRVDVGCDGFYQSSAVLALSPDGTFGWNDTVRYGTWTQDGAHIYLTYGNKELREEWEVNCSGTNLGIQLDENGGLTCYDGYRERR
jgi:hypothetical protein